MTNNFSFCVIVMLATRVVAGVAACSAVFASKHAVQPIMSLQSTKRCISLEPRQKHNLTSTAWSIQHQLELKELMQVLQHRHRRHSYRQRCTLHTQRV